MPKLHWSLVALIGASINVFVNLGFKLAGPDVGVTPIATAVMGGAALIVAIYALATRQSGWQHALTGRRLPIIAALGLGLTGVYAFFFTALTQGPISLVDPLWACIYSLVSLVLGIMLIRERPHPLALLGIALYIAGAGFVSYGQHTGGSLFASWVALVLVGGSLNALLNFCYKLTAQKVSIFCLIPLTYAFAMLGFIGYGLFTDANYAALLEPRVAATVIAMSIGCALQVTLFTIALRDGPISIVDPLWACVYALGSVAVGMVLADESPSSIALAGVALYLAGVVFMAREGLRRSKRRQLQTP